MPRSKRQDDEQIKGPLGSAALRAAGARLTGRAAANAASRSGKAWQDRCWDYYDVVGEYRYGADWVGSMLSRATLFAAKDGHRIENPSESVDQAVAEYVTDLYGGPDQQPQMLRETGIHLTVAGEEYLIGWTEKGQDKWRIVASTEFTSRAGRYYLSGKQLPDSEPLVIRIWRPHPRRYSEANSPSRAILPILAELDVLTKRIFAEIDSRLAGAGVFFLPNNMTLATSVVGVDGEGNPVSQGPQVSMADVFQQALQAAMTTAVEDQADASALVPIVVTTDAQNIENGIKLQTFWSELDAVSIELRTEAIRRLALGLDMPPEVLTGTADLTHWNAWALEESGIKAHVEPVLGLITESLTAGYLWPLLQSDGVDEDEARRYTIEADTAELRLRPNRSKEAVELWQNKALSTASMLREVGFDPLLDSPTSKEFQNRLLAGVAQGQTTPELVEAALRELGVPLPAAPVVTETSAPAEARPDPSLEGHPLTGPPQRTTTGPDQDGQPPAGEQMALVAAAEVMVHRALERAGNRLRVKLGGRKIDGVAAGEMYLHVPVTASLQDDLLADAFTGLERYTVCSQVDPDKLSAALDAYCRLLLTERKPVDPGDLAAYVEVARDATARARTGVLV